MIQVIKYLILALLLVVNRSEIKDQPGNFMNNSFDESDLKSKKIRLFLCGDVMTGRGIDQVLPHPGDARLRESYMKSAKGYVELAEKTNGTIPYPVDFSYIWGEAMGYWEKMAPDLKIINLETAITLSDRFWPGKAVNYRMNPKNIPVLSEAGIDFCSLANNHILDFHEEGLESTMLTLTDANIHFAGCGEDIDAAIDPTIISVGDKGRVILFSLGMRNSGIPFSWKATSKDPGLFLVDPGPDAARLILEKLKKIEKPGDVVVISLHWGGNWGYDIPRVHSEFAHALIDIAGADVIHGHSSHHVLGIEVYRNRPILYGCGDFINDYEGISGYESFRDDLTLMYFPDIDTSTGEMISLTMVPLQIRKFRLNKASERDTKWLSAVLNREGKKFGTSVKVSADRILNLHW